MKLVPKTINTVNTNWYFIRVVALLAIPTFILDLETLFLIQNLLLVHVRAGFESIIYDYIHTRITQILYLLLVRILTLEASFCLIESIL